MSQFGDIVKSARDFACRLYSEQPGALIPNPGETVLRMAWDAVCPTPEYAPPPVPAPQYVGGQCVRVAYRVTFEFKAEFRGQELTDNYTLDLFGALGKGTWRILANGLLWMEMECHGVVGSAYSDALITVGREGYQTVGINNIRLTNLTVSRLDNQPDNCGNPPSGYPPPTIQPPYVSPPITINHNDGTDYNITVTVNPPVPPGFGKPPPPVGVDINGPNFKFPIDFDFDGNVNIGENGGGGDSDLNDKFDDFKNEWDDFKDDWDFDHNPPDLDTDPDVNKDDKEPDKEGEEDNIEGLIGVKLTLTKPSSDAQFGTPTVYFAGWLTFKLQGGQVERVPVNFETGYFPAPAGATGYAYTLTKGAEGAIRVYKKQVEEAE